MAKTAAQIRAEKEFKIKKRNLAIAQKARKRTGATVTTESVRKAGEIDISRELPNLSPVDTNLGTVDEPLSFGTELKEGETGALSPEEVSANKETERRKKLASSEAGLEILSEEDRLEKQKEEQKRLNRERSKSSEESFEAQKTSIEKTLEILKKDLTLDKKQATRQFEGAESGIKSEGAVEPGTFTSSTNKALTQGFLRVNTEKKERQKRAFESQIAGITDLQRKIATATEERDFDKRQDLLDDFFDLEDQRKELEEAMENERAEETKNVLGLLKDGDGNLTDEEIISISEMTSIPPFLIKSINNAQKKGDTQATAEAERKAIEFSERNLSAEQKSINGYKALLKNEDINQAQFDAAVKNQIETPKQYQFGTLDDGTDVVRDPSTGRVTPVNLGITGENRAPSLADVGSGNITLDYGDPTDNKIDNVLLQNGKTGHPGIDKDGRSGEAILAFTKGSILSMGDAGDYGNQVVIQDSEGNNHMYSHLNDVPDFLKIGQEINAGDNIGFMGNTGFVMDINGNRVDTSKDQETGSHLDYRVWAKNTVNGSRWANPHDFIRKPIDTKGEFDEALLPLYKKFNEGKLTDGDRKSIKKLGIPFGEFKNQALASKAVSDVKGINFAMEIINLAQDLKTKEGRTGAAFGLGLIPFTDARNFKTTFNSLISKLSLENLIQLKADGATFGALSDNELQFIQSAATKLDPGSDDFQKELTSIIDKISKTTGELRIISETDKIEQIDAMIDKMESEGRSEEEIKQVIINAGINPLQFYN